MAIAFVAAGGSAGSASSLSYTLDVGSAANRRIWGGTFEGSGSDPVTAHTYAGVALAEIAGSPMSINGHKQGLYNLKAPASGSNTHAITFTAGGNVTLHGAAFSGADQTDNTPDATNTSDIGVTSHPQQAVTTVADNCFVVWLVRGESGNALTPDSGTSMANEYSPFDEHLMYSTAAKTPAGSVTLGATGASSHHYGIIASFAPVPSPADLSINLNDSVTVAEAVTMMVDENVNLNDSVTVAESVSIDFPVEMSVFDAVTVDDSSVTVFETNLSIVVAEDVAVAESVTIFYDVLVISVFDSIAVAETLGETLSVPPIGLIHMRSTEQAYPLMMDENEVNS